MHTGAVVCTQGRADVGRVAVRSACARALQEPQVTGRFLEEHGGLEAIISQEVSHCSVLDLQGDLLHSTPITIEGNTTLVYPSNSTLHLLATV